MELINFIFLLLPKNACILSCQGPLVPNQNIISFEFEFKKKILSKTAWKGTKLRAIFIKYASVMAKPYFHEKIN